MYQCIYVSMYLHAPRIFCRFASYPARARFRTRLVTKPKRLHSFSSSSSSKKSYWPKTAIISCRSRKPAASWAVFQPLRMAKWPTSNFPFSILRGFYTLTHAFSFDPWRYQQPIRKAGKDSSPACKGDRHIFRCNGS